MVRTSLSVHGRRMRVQAVRHKREAIESASNADARALHATEQPMLLVVEPGSGPLKAAWPKAAPDSCVDPMIAENVSKYGANSHNVAFETRLSKQTRNHGSTSSGKTGLREGVRAAMALSRLAGREVPANGRESPGTAA